jgi:hypothetical protein
MNAQLKTNKDKLPSFFLSKKKKIVMEGTDPPEIDDVILIPFTVYKQGRQRVVWIPMNPPISEPVFKDVKSDR